MAAYQVRLPEAYDLERWLDEVSWAVWNQLAGRLDTSTLTPHVFVRIHEILHDAFRAHVKTYRSCGLWSYCRAGTKPGPWMPLEAYQPDEIHVRWYVVQPCEALETMITDAAEQIAGLVIDILGGTSSREGIARASAAGLREGVGRYLYENTRCGGNPFCQGAVAMDPWIPEEMPSWVSELFRPHQTEEMSAAKS